MSAQDQLQIPIIDDNPVYGPSSNAGELENHASGPSGEAGEPETQPDEVVVPASVQSNEDGDIGQANEALGWQSLALNMALMNSAFAGSRVHHYAFVVENHFDGAGNKLSAAMQQLSIGPNTVTTNSSVMTVDKFETFSDLPLEIRLKIWSLALPGARNIGFGHQSALPVPVLLHICRESRNVALERFQLFEHHVPRRSPVKVYVDFKIDRFSAEIFRVGDHDFKSLIDPLPRPVLNNIQRMQVSFCLRKPGWLCNDIGSRNFFQCLPLLGGLKELKFTFNSHMGEILELVEEVPGTGPVGPFHLSSFVRGIQRCEIVHRANIKFIMCHIEIEALENPEWNARDVLFRFELMPQAWRCAYYLPPDPTEEE